MFTSRHEQDLAEIKALYGALDQHVREGLAQLARIREAQERLAARGQPRASSAVDRNGGEPLVAFVHIPKTAGGAVTTMFANAYSRKGTYNTANYISSPEKTVAKVTKRPGGWERSQRKGVRVAIGHTPYGVFREGNLPPDTRYITFLREPVDRVLSHYYRHVHLPETSGAEPRGQRKRARSLEEALVEMRLPQLRNICTRFLCSHPTLGELPPSAVDEAKENLRTFAFVGIQERFEESIVLLQRTLGIGVVPYLNRHVSAAGSRPSVDEISDAERALIEECNQLDAELYAFGLELLEEALAATDDDFTADVERLRGAAEAAGREHRAAVEAARVWLDRELPPGATEPKKSLIARAEAAGLTRPAVTEARKELLVVGDRGSDGKPTLRRASGDSLTALEDAKAWLDRELPAGASEPQAALIERGEASG
jgi:sulfotransferase famil protein